MSAPTLQSLINSTQAILDHLAAERDKAGLPAPATPPDQSQPTLPPPDTLLPPYALTGIMTIFGLNYDGSEDTGDEDSHGVALHGAWGDETHNKEIVGISMPILVVTSTFGTRQSKPLETVEIYSQVTQKTVLGVHFCDLGPAARVHRPFDGTYKLHEMLGHIDYGLQHYGAYSLGHWPAGFPVTAWIEGSDGKALPILGWDFQLGRVKGS